jgi:hypothetical protein
MAKRGDVQEYLIWMLVQLLMAAAVTLMLYGFVTLALDKGIVFKSFYPGNLAMTMDAVAAGNNMVVVDHVASFKMATGTVIFSIENKDNALSITATSMKGPSKHFFFTPAELAVEPSKLDPATGIIEMQKTNKLTMVKATNKAVPLGYYPCQAMENWRVLVIDADKRYESTASTLSGMVEDALPMPADEQSRNMALTEADAILSLNADPAKLGDNRAVILYSGNPGIACRVANALIEKGLSVAMLPVGRTTGTGRIDVVLDINAGHALSNSLNMATAISSALKEKHA